MDEKLPYEEEWGQHMDDLPMPDQETSWQQMSRMLDEEEDDRRILPPILLRSCAGWGLLFLLLTGAGLWYFTYRQHTLPSTQVSKVEQKDTMIPSPAQTKLSRKEMMDTDYISHKIKTSQDPEHEVQPLEKSETKGATMPAVEASKNEQTIKPKKPKQQNRESVLQTDEETHLIKKKRMRTTASPIEKNVKTHPGTEHQPTSTHRMVTNERKDTTSVSIETSTIKHKDSTDQKKATDSVPPNQDERKKTQTKKHFVFSMGIGEQQQLPINGQKTTPYNYYGRKGSLADYIPSVYVRLERDRKWFLQSEFRYGAPQAVKQITYNSHSVSDTFGTRTTTTSLTIKKTFYHQVPLSFNYYVLRNWSVGTGILYSRFHGAISEQTIKEKNTSTGAEKILSQKIVKVPANTDSFFTKSQVHLLFQTQYQWKRFSLGARYNIGLQPYIKYIDASGQKQQKNQSLELYLRMELWRK